jgi:hypothetical protein
MGAWARDRLRVYSWISSPPPSFCPKGNTPYPPLPTQALVSCLRYCLRRLSGTVLSATAAECGTKVFRAIITNASTHKPPAVEAAAKGLADVWNARVAGMMMMTAGGEPANEVGGTRGGVSR